MELLIVTFSLEGITEAEYLRGCDADAAAFADVPGLVSKVWLADAASNTYGGVYTFEDAASRDAYLSSELFAGLKAMPVFADVVARPFAVLAGPSRVTRGMAPAAA